MICRLCIVQWFPPLSEQENRLESLFRHRVLSPSPEFWLRRCTLYTLKKNLLTTYFFLSFWLCWVLSAVRAFSSCGEWGPPSSCGVWASHCDGLSRCGARAQELCSMGLAAPRMWDLSSWTRDQAHVPCNGRWILHRWTTREVPY